MEYLPPQNWQDFEKFVLSVVEVKWDKEDVQIYGRQGQYQSGIDIYTDDNRGKFTGIQCKKKNLTNSEGEILKNSTLTKALITEEIKKAKEIDSPPLKRFILATTSYRDTKVQDIIRAENAKDKELSIEVWFWDDFETFIERDIRLMYWYYEDLLKKVKKYNPDIHILSLNKQVFSRPAFERKMCREEGLTDFLQAIKDTQEAIRTGFLYNRRGDLITKSLPTSKLSKKSHRKKFNEIWNELDKIRDLYNEGIKKGLIVEEDTLHIRDDNLIHQFDEGRKTCLKKLNTILKKYNICKVKSELLK